MMTFGFDFSRHRTAPPSRVIPHGGQFSATQYANDANIGAMTGPHFAFHGWFKPNVTENWTGTRVMYSVGALIDEGNDTEDGMLRVYITRPTLGSALLYVTVYWNIDSNGNYDAAYYGAVSSANLWHRIWGYWAPEDGNAAIEIDDSGAYIDEMLNYLTIPTVAYNACQINQGGGYLQGSIVYDGMPGAYADFYFISNYIPSYISIGYEMLDPYTGQPINVGNGSDVGGVGALAQVYYKSWNGVTGTLANTGSGGSAEINPDNLVTVNGPTQWGQP